MTSRFRRLGLAACIAGLSACGGGGSSSPGAPPPLPLATPTPTPAGSGAPTATPSASPRSSPSASPMATRSPQPTPSPTPPVGAAPSLVAVGSLQSGNIDFFSPTANGTTPPLRSLNAGGSGASVSTALVFDAAGDLYAAQLVPERVVEFAPGASGAATPLRSISGNLTGISAPVGLALDPAGEVVVANSAAGSITIYAAGANGNVAPLHTIAGALTGLTPSAGGLTPGAVAVDAGGAIYVAASSNQTGGAIFVFAAGSYGNVAPTRTIAGSNTGIDGPLGLAFDNAGYLYVANHHDNTVTTYAPGATGNAIVARGFFSSSISGSAAIAADQIGNLYLVNQTAGFSGSYLVFASSSNGLGIPIDNVSSPADRFSQAYGIAVF